MSRMRGVISPLTATKTLLPFPFRPPRRVVFNAFTYGHVVASLFNSSIYPNLGHSFFLVRLLGIFVSTWLRWPIIPRSTLRLRRIQVRDDKRAELRIISLD